MNVIDKKNTVQENFWFIIIVEMVYFSEHFKIYVNNKLYCYIADKYNMCKCYMHGGNHYATH